METLWLAILLYSIGLALVLQFRPALMFNENGTWKEFGYQRTSRHTLFPFWLFSIVWAFVSYALAAVIGTSYAAAPAAAVAYASTVYDEDDAASSDEDIAIPVSRTEPPKRGRGRPRKTESQPRPGYYVLNTDAPATNGLRKYIYYGPEPPQE